MKGSCSNKLRSLFNKYSDTDSRISDKFNIAKDNNSSHYQSSVGPGGIFMFIALTLICVYVFSVSDHD